MSPEDASNSTVTWSSGNNDIAVVDDQGCVTAKAQGNTVITATTKNGNFTAQCRIEVKEAQPEPVKVTEVAVEPSEIILREGETEKLTSEISPDNAANKNVIWSSEDSTIAEVDGEGNVSGINVGTTVVTATTEDGGFTANCSITVEAEEPEEIGVSGITINTGELTVEVGSTEKLTAEVEPFDAVNRNVIWASGDSSIAEVDGEGNVTGRKTGTTVVKVTTEDGGFTAECSITVKEKEAEVTETIAATGVKLKPSELILKIGETDKVQAVIAPVDASNTHVTWTTKDKSVAEVDEEGNVTAKAEGTTVISAKTEDGGYTAACKVTVKREVTSNNEIKGNTKTSSDNKSKPSQQSSAKASSVKTGDNTNVVGILILFTVSFMVCVCLMISMRTKHWKNK